MNEIIQLDKEAFIYLNSLGNTTWDWFWIAISERSYWIPFYLFLLFILYRTIGLKRTGLVLGLTLLMVLFTDQITNIFKDGFQRLRPCFHEEFQGIMRGVGCERRGKFGFTSAHASNHFAIAFLLGLILKNRFKWIFPVLIVWAFLISYSRIYLGVHFPLDVICGGTMGVLFGIGMFKLYQFILAKYPEKFES